MKVDTGNCALCGAKNSKFVEKCYKCHATLPWGAGFQAPKPVPPAPVAPPPKSPPSPNVAPPLTPTVLIPEAPAFPSAPIPIPPPSHSFAPPAYQGDALAPNEYPAPPMQPVQPGFAPPPYYPSAPMNHRPMPMGPMICQACGYSGHAQTFMQGSTLVGVILCLLWLVPGILYFIWQSTTKYEGCPQCKGQSLVPLHSPQGQFSASHFYGN